MIPQAFKSIERSAVRRRARANRLAHSHGHQQQREAEDKCVGAKALGLRVRKRHQLHGIVSFTYPRKITSMREKDRNIRKLKAHS